MTVENKEKEADPSFQKKIEESKKFINSYRDSVENPISRISYDGATILCVLLSLKPSFKTSVPLELSSLPEEDSILIRSKLIRKVLNYF